MIYRKVAETKEFPYIFHTAAPPSSLLPKLEDN